MAITAWSAKVSSNLIWYSAKGRTSRRWIAIAPIRLFSFKQWHREVGLESPSSLVGFRDNALGVSKHVRNMDGPFFKSHSDGLRSLVPAGSACSQ